MFKLIFLYGVWFNPEQIVSLTTLHGDFISGYECRINFSRGQYQEGIDNIKTKETCDIAAKRIMEAVK